MERLWRARGSRGEIGSEGGELCVRKTSGLGVLGYHLLLVVIVVVVVVVVVKWKALKELRFALGH